MLRRLLQEALGKERVTCYGLWKKLKINQGLLSAFFSGKKDISLKNLERIVDFLNYEIFLMPKSEIGRAQHKKKREEAIKIAEGMIGRIILEFEENYEVYVEAIDVGNGKIKITYREGESGMKPPRHRL